MTKAILLVLGISFLTTFGIFFLEAKFNSIPDTNKFKQWWRRTVVGEEK